MLDVSINTAYDCALKRDFELKAKEFAKSLSKELNFTECKIRYNPGGIAVSGDITMFGKFQNGKFMYMTISTPSSHGIMFRSASSMEDYSGGTNQWFNPSAFETYHGLARHIKWVLNVV